MTQTLQDGYEPAEVSAAKSIVQVTLDDHVLDEDVDTIALADAIITALLEAGITIPEDIIDPVTGKSAQAQ